MQLWLLAFDSRWKRVTTRLHLESKPHAQLDTGPGGAQRLSALDGKELIFSGNQKAVFRVSRSWFGYRTIRVIWLRKWQQNGAGTRLTVALAWGA